MRGVKDRASRIRMFQSFCDKRAVRAHYLSKSYPESAEALLFYAELASFQSNTIHTWESLISIVLSCGPKDLRQAARNFDQQTCDKAISNYRSGSDRKSVQSFFARVLLQPEVATQPEDSLSAEPGVCPRCGHLPQVGCMVVQGEGSALELFCSLCFHRWRSVRGYCSVCKAKRDRKLAYFKASEFEHTQIQVCEICRHYLHILYSEKLSGAVPDVDEIAGLSLDVWAHKKGYRKVMPNLIGI